MSSGFTQTNLLRQELFFSNFYVNNGDNLSKIALFWTFLEKKKFSGEHKNCFSFSFFIENVEQTLQSFCFLQQPKCRQSIFICCFLKAKATNNFQKKRKTVENCRFFFSDQISTTNFGINFWFLAAWVPKGFTSWLMEQKQHLFSFWSFTQMVSVCYFSKKSTFIFLPF